MDLEYLAKKSLEKLFFFHATGRPFDNRRHRKQLQMELSWIMREIFPATFNLGILFSWASLVAQLGKNLSACYEGDLGLILGLGRSPGEGKGYPLQYSGLEN